MNQDNSIIQNIFWNDRFHPKFTQWSKWASSLCFNTAYNFSRFFPRFSLFWCHKGDNEKFSSLSFELFWHKYWRKISNTSYKKLTPLEHEWIFHWLSQVLKKYSQTQVKKTWFDGIFVLVVLVVRWQDTCVLCDGSCWTKSEISDELMMVE